MSEPRVVRPITEPVRRHRGEQHVFLVKRLSGADS